MAVFLSNKLIPIPQEDFFVFETIHSIKLKINPSEDKGIEWNLYRFGTYEKGIINFIQKHLKEGQTFLDIGANIGLLSCVASKKVKDSGKIIAVEANPKTIEILKFNLELNNCKNAAIIPFGLGDVKTKELFYQNTKLYRGGASFLNQGNESGTEIEIDTIDNLFPNEKLDMVKIDVEGFELKVLEGGVNVFKKNRPIFIIEVSTNREQEVGVTPSEIRQFILDLGNYKLFKFSGTKERISKLIEVKSDKDLPEHDNLICLPN